MSSTYPWIKDSSTLSGTPPTDRLAVTSPNGLYFSTSTNSSILAPSNSDLTIETAGTGDVIVKTNSNNRLTIDDSGTVTAAKNIAITDGSLTINNTTGGGTSDPLLVLNQALSSQTLYEERNNTKTNVSSSQTLYQVSYKGLPSVGSTAVEYANMRVTAQSYTSGSQTSKIDFAVGPSYQSVLSIQPNFLQMTGNVYLPSRYISGLSYAQTQYSNYLVPQTPNFIDSSTTLSFTPELANGQRIFYANKGSTNAFLPITGTFPGGGGAYCSESFAGRIWVGSDNSIFWTSDNGASWNRFSDSSGDPYVFNGQITCMKNTGTNLYFGGTFTETTYGTTTPTTLSLNYVGYINSIIAVSQLNWSNWGGISDVGLNAYVNTIEAYSGYVYYGGNFTGSQYNSLQCRYIACSDESMIRLYALNDLSNSGFDQEVIIIKSDGGSNRFIIGGNFTQFYDPYTIYSALYCVYLDVSNYNVSLIQDFGFNAPTFTISQYVGSLLVGGSFSSTGYGDYLVSISHNGTNYTLSVAPFSPTLTSSVNLIFYSPSSGFVYWALSSSPYNLYRNGSLLGNSPGNYWRCITYLSGSDGLSDCFAPNGSQFYYFAGDSLNITIGSTPVVNAGTEYTSGTITLPNKGTAIEFAYDNVGQKLYVLSNNGATGIGGGGGGITTISAGSGISVTNPSGPTTTISNSGVIALTAGTNTSVSNLGGGTWQVNASGGGGGGDVYWSQLNDAYSTYSNLSSGSSSNNPYSFGLNNASGTPNLSITMELNAYEVDYLNLITYAQNPYLRVGQQTTGLSGGYYTLLAGVNDTTNNEYTTLATINSNMHLYANKDGTANARGNGNIYLYGVEILPGNDVFNPLTPPTTFLGNGTYYWKEVYSAVFNQVSDIKLKENISTLDTQYSVDFIKRINPVSYTFKKDEKQKTHFGVIAQEIKEIIGDKKFGLHNDSGENQTVAYTEFIAPLIKTVQHLLKKVESLENEIKILKQ